MKIKGRLWFCLHLIFSAPFGSYFDVYTDMWDKQREDPNGLIVMYEELKRVSGPRFIFPNG